MLGELSGAAAAVGDERQGPALRNSRSGAGGGRRCAPPAPDQALELVPVSSASAGLRFASSVATLDRGEVVTPSYTASVQGWIGMLDGSLGLNGIVTPGGATASPTPSTTPLPVAATPAPAPPDAAATATAPVTTPPVVASVPSAPGIPFTIEGTLAAPVVRTQ